VAIIRLATVPWMLRWDWYLRVMDFCFLLFHRCLGWLGVALIGSENSSNVLFENLKQINAERVGISSVLAAASNRPHPISLGGATGTMIDAQ